MTIEKQESTLSRWSRRKLAQQQTAVNREIPVEASPELESAPLAETKAEQLTDADMPPLETLNEDSDFSAFMSEGVSDELRNLALRKLFKSPVFNICDGLDEYDEDYTYFEKLGDIVTCDMKHQVEMQARKLRDAEEAEARERENKAARAEIEEDADDIEQIDDDDDVADDATVEPLAQAQPESDETQDINHES